MDLIADTSLLVGLWRKQSWAVDFARNNSSLILGLPWVVLGEFWHGAKRAGHDERKVEEFLRIGLPLYDTELVIKNYAKMCAEAQSEGFYGEIGQNDLWIAAVSICYQLPLVSRNRRHFYRIQNLRLQSLTD